MSEGWRDGQFELFKCPICGDRSYVEVRVRLPSGVWYTTPFLKCIGCTVMFTDPVSFSGLRIRAESKTKDMYPAGTYGVMPSAKRDEGEK